jgi:hypothetical protein
MTSLVCARSGVLVTKKWIAVVASAALFTASTLPLSAQTTSSNSGHPIVLAQESGGASTSGGATSGGATSGGATSPAPAPEAAPPPTEAPAPGPEAGPVAAAAVPFNPFIVGGVVAAGVIICAIVCFGKSSTSTSTH